MDKNKIFIEYIYFFTDQYITNITIQKIVELMYLWKATFAVIISDKMWLMKQSEYKLPHLDLINNLQYENINL